MWYIFNWYDIVKINIKFKWIINIRIKLNTPYKYITLFYKQYYKLTITTFIHKWNIIIWCIKKNWFNLFRLLYNKFIKYITHHNLISLFININWLRNIKLKYLINKKYSSQFI